MFQLIYHLNLISSLSLQDVLDFLYILKETSLEDLGAATCKLVNLVDRKVLSPKSKVQSPSEVLQKS